MKKSIRTLANLALLSIISFASGCSSNSPSGSNDTPNQLTITNEDKRSPGSSTLDYVDYSESDKNYDTSKWYKNELTEIPLPDPFVLEDDGTYYIYGTTDRTAANSFDCYSTIDFNTFTWHSNVYTPSATSITKSSLFAPEVYKIGDTYYMYYSGGTGGQTIINVLVSDSPTGPFVEYSGKNFFGEDVNYATEPFIEDIKSGFSLSILDVTLLVDGESLYLYYSVYHTNVMQYIVGMELFDPVTPNWDSYVILNRPGELTPKTTGTNALNWETITGFKVAEGPCVTKSPVNGKYYMSYSVNHYPNRYYSVCYAVSDTPLGEYNKPFEKGKAWTNLLFGYAGAGQGTVYDQWDGFMSGTAHHSIFKAGDDWMIVYHAHKNRKDSNSGRMACFDHLYWDKDGVPHCQGPTSSINYLPESVSGYKNVAPLATKVLTEGISGPERINDNLYSEHYNLAQEADYEAVLQGGKSYIKFKLDKAYDIGGIQIYNSAFFDKMIEVVDFVKFGKECVSQPTFNFNYVNYEKDFIFPGSAITVDLTEDIATDEIIIGFDNPDEVQLSEVVILGK